MLKPRFRTFAAGLCVAVLCVGSAWERHAEATTAKDLLLYSHAELRWHAAEVFSTLTKGRKTPKWEDRPAWQDQCDLDLMRDCEKMPIEHGIADLEFHFLHSLASPPQDTADEAPGPQNDQFPTIFQSIYYNASAAKTIRKNHLSEQAALDARLHQVLAAHVKLSGQTVPDFDPNAMIIKTIWETVDLTGPNSKPNFAVDDITQRPISKSSPKTPPPLEALIVWHSKIHISVDPKNPDGPCTIDLPSKTYSLGCFHYRVITSQQLGRFAPRDVDREFCIGTCYMILVGVHIMSRETPNWTWMTFRWTNETHRTLVKDKWDFFDGDAVVDNQAFLANPYLEGPNGNGMQTNCMECHRKAVYNPVFGARPGSANGVPSELPNPDLQSPSCYFQSAVQTHFLWTIALNQPTPANPSVADPCVKPAPAGGTIK